MRKRYKQKSKRTGKFKSHLEERISKVLGKKAKYETETLHYLLPKKYIPDFIVKIKDKKIYIEVKGWLRGDDQRKMRAVKVSNPDLDIRMFFAKDNKVQGSKMTNSQWCEKYGFTYAIDKIPKEWFI